MTGAYFRVKRNGKFENIEMEYLTDSERWDLLNARDVNYMLSCLDVACKKLRENEALLDDLVKDGILEANTN